MSNLKNFTKDIEATKNEELTRLFEEYKSSDDYKHYFEMIKQDKPNLSIYLINIILYGYFYENFLGSLDYEERVKYTSLVQQEHKIIPPVKGEIKGVGVYSSEKEYKELNPHLTEIKTIGEPLTFIEHKPTEIEENIKDLLNEPIEETTIKSKTGNGFGHNISTLAQSLKVEPQNEII